MTPAVAHAVIGDALRERLELISTLTALRDWTAKAITVDAEIGMSRHTFAEIMRRADDLLAKVSE